MTGALSVSAEIGIAEAVVCCAATMCSGGATLGRESTLCPNTARPTQSRSRADADPDGADDPAALL